MLLAHTTCLQSSTGLCGRKTLVYALKMAGERRQARQAGPTITFTAKQIPGIMLHLAGRLKKMNVA